MMLQKPSAVVMRCKVETSGATWDRILWCKHALLLSLFLRLMTEKIFAVNTQLYLCSTLMLLPLGEMLNRSAEQLWIWREVHDTSFSKSIFLISGLWNCQIQKQLTQDVLHVQFWMCETAPKKWNNLQHLQGAIILHKSKCCHMLSLWQSQMIQLKKWLVRAQIQKLKVSSPARLQVCGDTTSAGNLQTVTGVRGTDHSTATASQHVAYSDTSTENDHLCSSSQRYRDLNLFWVIVLNIRSYLCPRSPQQQKADGHSQRAAGERSGLFG